jgi:hypothetical protein
MPMSIVYTYVYKIWRGLLFIIIAMGMGMPRITVIAAVPRLFCVLKLLLSVISAFILFFPTN